MYMRMHVYTFTKILYNNYMCLHFQIVLYLSHLKALHQSYRGLMTQAKDEKFRPQSKSTLLYSNDAKCFIPNNLSLYIPKSFLQVFDLRIIR